MAVFEIETYKKCALISITQQVREAVSKSGVKRGLATVYSPHTTAGITINENADPDVAIDLLTALEAQVPDIAFRHGEGNSDAHLKTTLTGVFACIPVENGELMLGTWQGVYFCEFDGPRRRRFYVSVTG